MSQNDLRESLNKNIEAIESFSSKNFAHDEVGEANGFHQAQLVFDQTREYLEDLLQRASENFDSINRVILKTHLEVIQSWLATSGKVIDRIDNLVATGLHAQTFPDQRQKLINEVITQSENLQRNLQPLRIEVRLTEIGDKLLGDGALEKLKKDTSEAIEKVKKDSAAAEKLLSAAQKKTVQKGVDESASQFRNLVDSHRSFEWSWFWAMLVSAALFAGTIAYLVLTNNAGEGFDGVVEILKKIVLISASGVFLRISIAKYNTERALRIVYEHRQEVLGQYRMFEAGIGDDTAAKNQFRLEIAKYIFSDPHIGYSATEKGASQEISINPIIAAAEGLSKSK